MALQRLTLDGYGQIELNQVAFRRDGRIEAQCKLDEAQFDKDHPCENGMLLAVDNVTRTIHLPTASVAESGTEGQEGYVAPVAGYDTFPIALHYSTEHIYDERTPGLKNFALYPQYRPQYYGFESYVYPRLGYLAVGDKFTSNCVCYDDGEFATEEDLIDALADVENTPLYGGISDIGAIKISATAPSAGPVLAVRWADTMPDGQNAVGFICVRD
jgi:hypothetical protein